MEAEENDRHVFDAPFSPAPSVTLAQPRRVSSDKRRSTIFCVRFPGSDTIVASYCLLLGRVWDHLFEFVISRSFLSPPGSSRKLYLQFAHRDADTSYRLKKDLISSFKKLICLREFYYVSLMLLIMIHSPNYDDLFYQFLSLLVCYKKAFLDQSS